MRIEESRSNRALINGSEGVYSSLAQCIALSMSMGDKETYCPKAVGDGILLNRHLVLLLLDLRAAKLG